MIRNAFSVFVLIAITLSPVRASRLMEVRALDHEYLMLFFKDGEVVYRDDGTGESAYRGHSYAEGDAWLVSFGSGLDVEAVKDLSAWTLRSEEHHAYSGTGRHPVDVHRKSKPNNSTIEWEYELDHWIFLKLPEPLRQGASYTLEIDGSVGAEVGSVAISYDIFSNLSESVHLNMIGFAPGSPSKTADLYAWMGDGGERDYSSFEGNRVWLYDVSSGNKHLVDEVRFWMSNETDAEAEGRNLVGSDVWLTDFSDFNTPGTYRLVIEDVGCSREFDIRDDVYYDPYRTIVRGYYYMRVGEDRPDMVPVPRRPTFIPGKDPEGFTVYLTDLDPFDKEWREWPGDTWDEPHFKPAEQSIFYARRLPGNPINDKRVGGHSDAFDWDRHLAHVSNIYDLLLPYFLSGGMTGEDRLDIGESGNGIPDLIDEARNEVDLFLNLRVGDAYAHGLTNPSREYDIMFQAGTTTMAAWANAANCAMIADCFRISGHSDLMKYYTDEAMKAFRFAGLQEDQQLDDRQDVGDAVMRGRDFRMMAAAFLYNVTGDRKWEDIMAEESEVKDATSRVEDRRRGIQTWGTAAYLFTPRDRHYPDLYENMKASVRKQAFEHNVKHMELRPSRRSSNDNYWQTAHNLHPVILAHAVSEDPSERQRLEAAMVLEADWGLGRNPSNMVEMTGLGERCVVNCYTTGRNDGTPGLHPGHTPYHNLDNWGGDNNGSHPEWFTERCYPAWQSGWPHQEGHFNNRYSWANAEFTPRQTMRGKMALYGYLHSLYSFE